jgi:triosephosphate isomerase (TIM)
VSAHRVRRPVFAGNWKMNRGPREATSFFDTFLAHYLPHDDRTVLFLPPAISFAAAARAIRERPDIALGVQNAHWEKNGAFTGEIAAAMAAEAGARYLLAGHSERRHIFGETDEQVGLKAAAALAAGLIPLVCVGETLEQRRAGELTDVLLRQLDAATRHLADHAATVLVIAYEPVWAIGTGVNATPADAADAHRIVRDRLADRFGPVAAAIPILYGGSVKPDNAAELLAAPGVDGLLVGGASLDPTGFAHIANTRLYP